MPVVAPPTSGEAQHHYQWLQGIYEFAKFTAVFFAGYFTHALTVRRERAARIRNFRSHINLLLCQVNTMQAKRSGDPYFIYDWQKESIPAFLTECAKIREDIRPASKATFEKLLIEFSTQGDRNVDPYKFHRYEDKQNELRGILEPLLGSAQ